MTWSPTTNNPIKCTPSVEKSDFTITYFNLKRLDRNECDHAGLYSMCIVYSSSNFTSLDVLSFASCKQRWMKKIWWYASFSKYTNTWYPLAPQLRQALPGFFSLCNDTKSTISSPIVIVSVSCASVSMWCNCTARCGVWSDRHAQSGTSVRITIFLITSEYFRNG